MNRAPRPLLLTLAALSATLFTPAQPASGQIPGAPAEMAVLNGLAGNWDLQTLAPTSSGGWLPVPEIAPRAWSFAPILQGTMIEGRGSLEFPGGPTLDGIMIFSFDQWNHEYRAALLDSAYGLMDIYAGNWNSGGELVLTNGETGSAQSTATQRVFGQVRIAFENEHRVLMTVAQSVDDGATWSDFLRWELSRQRP